MGGASPGSEFAMAQTRSTILLPLTSLVLVGTVWNGSHMGQQLTGRTKEKEPEQTQQLRAQESKQPTTALVPLRPPTGVRSFTGRVVKIGNRYVLKDAVVGVTYDVNPQQAVTVFEGMTVRLNGTLDASGNIIRLESPQRY
jgi:hypothetical protein